jgi:hypothetical protein
MNRQTHFPEKGTVTRKIFFGVIAALAVAFLVGMVFGPALTAGGADPRPYAAILSLATYIALFAALGWVVWTVFRRGRNNDA